MQLKLHLRDNLQIKTTSLLRILADQFSSLPQSIFQLYNETTPLLRPIFFQPKDGVTVEVLLY